MKAWEEKDFFIGEDDYYEALHGGRVSLFVNAHLQSDRITSFDGKRICYYYAVHPDEKAMIVLVHGFCEFVNKFYETMYYFYQAGYSVCFVEMRGHGMSDRSNEQLEAELDKVHVDSYDEYVQDLNEVIEQRVKGLSTSGRLYLFSHSMGGAISTLYMEEYPDVFEKAVLSAPMLRVYFKGIPMAAVNLIALWSKIAGWRYRYSPTQHGFAGVECDFSTSNSMLSQPRFDYCYRCRVDNPRNSTYGGTYGWLIASIRATYQLQKHTDQIHTQIMLCQAGLDNMVDMEGQEQFLRSRPDVIRKVYPQSRHEIFDATPKIRQQYFTDIFTFFEPH